MEQYIVVKKLIHLAQKCATVEQETIRISSKLSFPFICIPGQYGPRWIIPAEPRLGMTVLKQWQPYNHLSTLKWRLILSLYQLGLLAKIPRVATLTINIDAGMHEIPVIYIGTPGEQQKAVATLVSIKTGEPQQILKIALGHKAKNSMAQEASILRALEGYAMPGMVPVCLECAESRNWTLQTVVEGHLSGRELSQAHIDWLLQLPRLRETTTLDEQRLQIQKLAMTCSFFNINTKQDILSRMKTIAGGKIPLVLVHGDFAPWNLKIQAEKKITAIDWEEAELKGLPLWDICHFFFIQGHLFNTSAPFDILMVNPLVRIYCEKLGLHQEQLVPLVLLYVLTMITDEGRTVSAPYREYLMQQVQFIA